MTAVSVRVLEAPKPAGASRQASKTPGDAADEPKVIWVTMPGGPYFLEEETRRRTRYAVVSALNVKDFVPCDPTHIGYYRAPPRENSALWLVFDSKKNHRHEDPGRQREKSLLWVADEQKPPASDFPQQAVPFEQFKEKWGNKAPIVVVWVDEDLLRAKPLKDLPNLLNTARPAAVIGPQSSTTLKNLVDESCPKPDKLGPTFSVLFPPVNRGPRQNRILFLRRDDARQRHTRLNARLALNSRFSQG